MQRKLLPEESCAYGNRNAEPVDINTTGSSFLLPRAQHSCCTEPFCISCTGTSLQTE